MLPAIDFTLIFYQIFLSTHVFYKTTAQEIKRNSTMTKYKLYAPSITKTSISRRERLDLDIYR